MIVVIARQLARMIAIMVAVSLTLFVLLEFDKESVATKVLGPYSSEEQRTLWLDANGYNEPLYLRYGGWLGNFFTGDFGDSIRYKGPVADILWSRLGQTGILGARRVRRHHPALANSGRSRRHARRLGARPHHFHHRDHHDLGAGVRLGGVHLVRSSSFGSASCRAPAAWPTGSRLPQLIMPALGAGAV